MPRFGFPNTCVVAVHFERMTIMRSESAVCDVAIKTCGILALGLASISPTHAHGQSVAWNRTSPASSPPARYSSAMVHDTARGVSLLFGGNANFEYLGDTWEWDGTTWNQGAFGGPSARSLHAMAFDSNRGVTVLFGGFNGDNFGDTWELGSDGWISIGVDGPSPRSTHAMAYDSARGVTVLFGGGPDFIANGETWEWDGTAWTPRLVAGPPARGYHAMAYDSARRTTVLFGGVDENGAVLRDTWEWDGFTWRQRSLAGPSARAYHSMAYDSGRRVTVLFGGSTGEGVSNAETWEWNGTTWTRHASGGPTRRFLQSMAYDARRGATVLFGGNLPPASDETWELLTPCNAPVITSGPTSQNGCPGLALSLSVSASGTGPFTYQWRRVEPPAEIADATGSTYTIAAAAASDAGLYECIVTNACGTVTSTQAQVTICIGDFNCDGGVDGSDIESFIVTWQTGEAAGDVNGDGGVDGGDVEFFFVRWEAGC